MRETLSTTPLFSSVQNACGKQMFPVRSLFQNRRTKISCRAVVRPRGFCACWKWWMPDRTGQAEENPLRTGYHQHCSVACCILLFAEKKAGELSLTSVSFTCVDTNRRHYDEFLPGRTYTNIVFNGNVRDDRSKLAFAQIMIGEIIAGNDTTDVLHFLVTENSRCETVIGLLDRLRIEGAKQCFLYNNDAWSFTGNLRQTP